MTNRLFLYIDILGFSELVADLEKVRELYNIIDQLNVFNHDPYYRCIVFSDTVLVYSDFDWNSDNRAGSSVMWMCEFAQDLFYRLIGRDIHFRGLLTVGPFEHQKLTHIESFFGDALVRTYRKEKEIACMGLFMDKRLVPCSDIFHTTPYDKDYHFVHVMQTLDRIRFAPADYPIPTDLILPMGTEWLHAYDLVYLKDLHRRMVDPNVPPSIRVKYLSTWQMLRTRSAGLMDVFERSGFDPRSVCNFDWSEPMRRVGTADGFHG